MRKSVLVFPLILAVSACVSENGKDIDQSKLASFQKGVTTKQQVIDALGQPNATGFQPDGISWVAYTHSKATISGASFVPIVGPLLGGTSGSADTCSFYFDTNEKYTTGGCSVMQSSGGAHIGG